MSVISGTIGAVAGEEASKEAAKTQAEFYQKALAMQERFMKEGRQMLGYAQKYVDPYVKMGTYAMQQIFGPEAYAEMQAAPGPLDLSAEQKSKQTAAYQTAQDFKAWWNDLPEHYQVGLLRNVGATVPSQDYQAKTDVGKSVQDKYAQGKDRLDWTNLPTESMNKLMGNVLTELVPAGINPNSIGSTRDWQKNMYPVDIFGNPTNVGAPYTPNAQNIANLGQQLPGAFESRGNLQNLLTQRMNTGIPPPQGPPNAPVQAPGPGLPQQMPVGNPQLGRLGNLLASLPRRAWGGPVRRAQPYLVGERGPEVFTPAVPGYVQANRGAPAMPGYVPQAQGQPAMPGYSNQRPTVPSAPGAPAYQGQPVGPGQVLTQPAAPARPAATTTPRPGGILGQYPDPFQPTPAPTSTPFDFSKYQESPWYQYPMQQGLQALERSAIGRGGLYSGQFADEINKQAQDYAFSKYLPARQAEEATQQNAYNQWLLGQNLGLNVNQNAFNQWLTGQLNPMMSLMGAGQNAAGASQGQIGGYYPSMQGTGGNMANLLGQQGNALASGPLGAASAYSNLFGNTSNTALGVLGLLYGGGLFGGAGAGAGSNPGAWGAFG